MGKKSLIKKTDKKEASSEKPEEEKKTKSAKKVKAPKKTAEGKKKTAARKAASPKKKTTKAEMEKKKAKPKTTAKKPGSAAKKQKTTAKKKVSGKAGKATRAPAPKAKKMTVKQLIFKRFDALKPEELYKPDPTEAMSQDYTAPPLVSGADEGEIRRIKALLLKKHDMADVIAAAEKAAAEKAAAEKDAAEKAAAEKAAAEKDAAEKAAAEKDAAERVTVAYEKPAGTHASTDNTDKTARYATVGLSAGVALIFLMIILASASNMANFYLKPTGNTLEILRGKFAPLGEKMFLSLPGVEAPEPIKDVYSKTEVYPIAFNHYLDKADALLKVTGMPDFERIKGYINMAMTYATTSEALNIARTRLNGIELMPLMYKAGVAESRGSAEDLDDALDFFDQAALLVTDDSQAQLIEGKIQSIEEKKRILEAAAAASEAAEPAEE